MALKDILTWILVLWVSLLIVYWLVWWPVACLVRRHRERESMCELERERPQFAAIVSRLRGRWEHEHVPHLSGVAAVAFVCQLALALLFFVLWILWTLWLTWSAGLGFLAVVIALVGIEATKRAARCPRCGGVPPSLTGW